MLFHRQAEHRKLTEIITDLKKEKAKMLELINRQTILIQELKAKDANALPVADAEELRERLRFVEVSLKQFRAYHFRLSPELRDKTLNI